ncbi:hypothetical protein [Streptomyces viridosporus]|uniref:hypothetical protein n=1 Tax=Streptomyces viridosporus TaxID=67581 RepID=UPI0009BCD4AE|nr:hypothetical protein [Streptomyces viridosporus]
MALAGLPPPGVGGHAAASGHHDAVERGDGNAPLAACNPYLAGLHARDRRPAPPTSTDNPKREE